MAQVSNQTELQQALDDGVLLIEILCDFTIESQITITYPATIQSVTETPARTLTRQTGFTGRLFSVEPGGNLTLRNLILDGDKANTPAARSAIATGSVLTMVNVTIQNNASTDAGGGICADSADAVVSMDNCVIQGCETNRDGGGMYNHHNSPTIKRCTFADNIARDNGGGGGMANDDSSPALTDCSFINNTASSGGGMYNSPGSNPTLTGCVFSNNHASGFEGGGMLNIYSSPTLTGCSFSNNTATSGGGMNIRSGSPMLTDCAFTGNTASQSGGGVFTQSVETSKPSFHNCTFSDNAALEGGGMYDSLGSPTLTGCTFSGNKARDCGGAVFGYYESATFDNCAITDNTAPSGGGIYHMLGSLTFRGGHIRGNSASKDGGGVYLISDGQLHLHAPAAVYGNSSANAGAGIYHKGLLGISGAVDIRDGVFLDSAERLIRVEGSLAGAYVQLEESPYVYPDPAKIPIDIAEATTEYPALNGTDAKAFIRPPSGFDSWYVHLNQKDTLVQLDFLAEYTITYKNLMGACNPNPTNYNAQALPIMLLPPSPIPCYRFIGWFDADGNKLAEIPAGTTENITLSARWAENPAPSCPICCRVCCCCRCYCCDCCDCYDRDLY